MLILAVFQLIFRLGAVCLLGTEGVEDRRRLSRPLAAAAQESVSISPSEPPQPSVTELPETEVDEEEEEGGRQL